MTRQRRLLLPLAAAFLIPFSFAVRGTDWAMFMHPDEVTVDAYMITAAKNGHPNVGWSVYPQGFFVLSNLYRRLCLFKSRFDGVENQEGSRHRDLDLVRAQTPKHDPSVAMGRHLNAVLAGLCGLFLFLAIREATGSVSGGLCAAMLGACSPFVVEHAHYCETDTGFCAGLALALWLLLGAVRRGSPAWTAGAAAACAAAFACKYTVAPLVPFCVAVCAAVCVRSVRGAGGDRAERRRRLERCALSALACFLAAVAAYALLTPVSWMDPELFWSRIFRIYGSVHREAANKDIAGTASFPLLRLFYIARSLALCFRMTGPVHLLLAAAGAAAFVRFRRRNPCGLWLLALVLAFVAFDLAVAPWIRTQEFLPLAILLGCIPALAAGDFCAAAAASGKRAVRLAVPAACFAVCALVAFGDANRAARMFQTEDTRNTMRHWLEMSASTNAVFAANRFASPALRYGRVATAERFGEPEWLWRPDEIDETDPGHDYFVRQALIPGRGAVDSRTGRLREHLAAGWTNFTAHAIHLRDWKPAPGYNTTFAQLPMELWGVVKPGARYVRPVPFAPRASVFHMAKEPYNVAQGGDLLGPVEAYRTVGARGTIRFVPPADGRPLYAVTRHVVGNVPAKVKWEGLFRPRSKTIEPGRADWFECKPGLFPADYGDMYAKTRVRMRGDDQTSLCLTTVTDNPGYAAELLVRGGSPDKAAELLAHAGLPPDPATAFARCAAPLPESFYRDFARIRFGDFSVFPDYSGVAAPGNGTDGADETDDLDGTRAPAARSPEERRRGVPIELPTHLDSEFPAVLDPGAYRVSFRLPPEKSDEPRVRSVGFTRVEEATLLSGSRFRPGETVVFRLVADRPSFPRIQADIEPGALSGVKLRDLTVEWVPLLENAAP